MLGFILQLGRVQVILRSRHGAGGVAQSATAISPRSPIEFILVSFYAPLVSLKALETNTLNDDTNMPFGLSSASLQLTFQFKRHVQNCFDHVSGLLGFPALPLRLAFWVTCLGCSKMFQAGLKVNSADRLSIMSAIESITWGALWLLPFYTELRFGLVAPWWQDVHRDLLLAAMAQVYMLFFEGGKTVGISPDISRHVQTVSDLQVYKAAIDPAYQKAKKKIPAELMDKMKEVHDGPCHIATLLAAAVHRC